MRVGRYKELKVGQKDECIYNAFSLGLTKFCHTSEQS